MPAGGPPRAPFDSIFLRGNSCGFGAGEKGELRYGGIGRREEIAVMHVSAVTSHPRSGFYALQDVGRRRLLELANEAESDLRKCQVVGDPHTDSTLDGD